MSMVRLPGLAVDEFAAHPLHADDRVWPETNCSVDLWIELLHSLGLEPTAALGCLFRCDFEGDQWEFFKIPPEDLRTLYGIDVHEFNLWRPIDDHIEEQLGFGRLLCIDIDSFFLPDTAGVSYRISHQKSSVAPTGIDRANEQLHYFHNRTHAILAGDDYRLALRLEDPEGLTPYAEIIRLDRLRRPAAPELRALAEQLLGVALSRRPLGNPVSLLGERIASDLPRVRGGGTDAFHDYAFGTLRQLGAWAELAASFLTWLDPNLYGPAASCLSALAGDAKACQFKLARVAAGRSADVAPLLDSLSRHWADAYRLLAADDER